MSDTTIPLRAGTAQHWCACRYVDSMDATQQRENTSSERALLRAVLAINRNKHSEDFGSAIHHVERTRCRPPVTGWSLTPLPLTNREI